MNLHKRTIISAMDPWRYQDSYTEIFLRVWFEEFDGPLDFAATPFDGEPHGREIWFRAMAGEYGPITVVAEPSPISIRERGLKQFRAVREPPKLLPPPEVNA